jgi:OmpA-OmpF porin, OOP family
MKKSFTLILILSVCVNFLSAQTFDFVPGGTVIFEDKFEQDPIGDFPARWSTSSDGEVVELDGFPGKWLRVNGNVAVNPELKKKLPEHCTIEFDVVMKKESCRAVFGITPISDVSAGNIFYKRIGVTLQNMTGYPDVVIGKDVQDIGSKNFSMEGYIDRILHVSIAVNKTRFRVYLDETKVADMPKVIVPEYRNNFFIAGGESIPAPHDGIYISNVRIASGDADARSLLIKQLFEQGSVVTNNINFNQQTNEVTKESLPILDTLGQAMAADPNLNIQINGMEQLPAMNDNGSGNGVMNENAGNNMMNEEMVRAKVDKMKAYIVQKFNIGVDRIVTGATNKMKKKMDEAKNSKTGTKLKGFLTEIVKL